MPPHLGIFLIWAGACVFLQLDHVDGDNKCVFPFIYGDNQYFDCTKENSLWAWCSLTEIYSGIWRYCVDEDYAPCVFPFIYRGKTYNNCTTAGSLFWNYWCSITPNYDQHKAWRYCP
ncbi:PREDICTED: seminal plasma protein pB1-like [Ceratotherium simum simum]|uniref:Seminal plasma protein pB1-like n=1 Tax=Ceratotherium simum simum TaxID=73337 RepID=A0ABM1DFF5_CERSS|nr:PREDICTED: seminal plasma protein pB1-like [Ceratotherium simum simum]